MRTPKDIEKYISSKIAAGRLMMIALEQILCVRDGVRVKWELKVKYFYPNDVLAKVTSPAVSMGNTWKSGTED
jgi:hypothetical protein